MLKQTVLDFYAKCNLNAGKFSARDGMLQGFKKQYGVKLSTIIDDETLSSQPELLNPFKLKLTQVMNTLFDYEVIDIQQTKITHSEILQTIKVATQLAESHNRTKLISVIFASLQNIKQNDAVENTCVTKIRTNLHHILNKCSVICIQ